MTTPRYRYLATNDEADSCACCGRTGLKRVVWLVALDCDGAPDGDPSPFGTTCGAHLLMDRQAGAARPKRSDAQKAIDAAHEDTLRAAAAMVADVKVPDGRWITNEYGVRCFEIGDRAYPATVGATDRDSESRARYAWLVDQARRIAKSWGVASAWRVGQYVGGE